jgi:anti-sigma factor RsiW
VTHSEIRARLSEYLERDLPGDQRAQVGAHLASCADCERELDALRDTVSMLRGLPEPELPAGISAAVMARIAQGEGREARVVSLFRRAAEPRFAAALAAGLAGLLFLSLPDARGPLPPLALAAAPLPSLELAAADAAFAADHAGFEHARRGARERAEGASAGVMSGFTPVAAYQQYVSQVRLEEARRRAEMQDVVRQLRGAGHPNSASLANHFEPRANVVLADWQPR